MFQTLRYNYKAEEEILILQIRKKGFEFGGWKVSSSETEGNWSETESYLPNTSSYLIFLFATEPSLLSVQPSPAVITPPFASAETA
mgnify:CR=1 FL=1